jgi:hypothetical protein
VWVDAATVRGTVDSYARVRARSELLARAHAECDGLVLADDTGVEMQLDGRVLFGSMQYRQLVTQGRFSADEWARTVSQPEVVCAVFTRPILAASDVPDADGPLQQVESVLRDRFVLREQAAGLWYYGEPR